ncbi:hypothetical protein BgiMline_009022 [Biomphalaria glabrata]|uniref:Uncharacterized protein LOC129925148 n=1 Tax=Biomphalaria glabrata TaxID=6526 RepID=A0A9W2ZXI9_BIOGL|nr:uncharacterized protein LOC129925148 [Biomphalaria glabrata]KAI8735326.1 hypothetical protein BgiMline_027596 [Biomphalaria glabrata]KAI8784608.1 Uncharacterized protein BgiBS90_014135 [Biomphalaria glabrata]KAI8785488.1 Uncharacterized protein BgiBS90_012846 [Biomphalaria glabrata]KAI8794106.1 Uncharacterized protein BgiBS90_004482 [Biomphalaria glabrata]KAI8794706.1 Uncharacterized protein BgiBS90_005082 [Biomphalaria glabrata]
MHITEIVDIVSDVGTAREFLRNHNILRRTPPNCPVPECGRRMSEISSADKKDGKVFRCSTHKGRKVSVREGSFLSKARLSLGEFIWLVYFWSMSTSNKTVMETLHFSSKTVVDWFNFLRGICTRYLTLHPIRLGGEGHVVEIDETVVARRKNHVGRYTPPKWVFGGIDTTTDDGFMVFVEDRSANTLLPIIEQYIEPGTMIHSDAWAAYNGIAHLPVLPPYQHNVVNHSTNFVDPATGATTNHVERMWKSMKQKLKRMSGTSDDLLQSHIDEFLWRQRRGKTGNDAFNNILEDISSFYPVP